MRRVDREITDKQVIEKILNDAEIIRLALVDDGEPYLVAMNFAYSQSCLFMHSAKQGRKIDIILKNNKVAFQTDTDVEMVLTNDASGCSTKYRSVVGLGRAFLIDDNEVKKIALDAIMLKHSGKDGFEYPEKLFERTLIIKVEIESMTGKKC